MRTSRCLLLVCFASLVAGTKLPKERQTISTSDPLQQFIPRRSASRPFYDENGVLWEANELQKNSLKPGISSPAQVMGGLTTEDIEDLSTLLLAIVGAELSHCVLGIVWDSGFGGSMVVDRLSLLPNVKQVPFIIIKQT